MKNSPGGQWRLDHDPFARPLGCNAKYGVSGTQRHQKAATPPCRRCLDSSAHYRRERRRGGLKPRTPQPCGTPAAAHRHRANNEPPCFKCRVAEARYRARLRNKQLAVPNGAASYVNGEK